MVPMAARAHWRGLVAVALLALTGCSGTVEPAEAATVGPIEELFNSIYGDWSEEDLRDEMQRIEGFIADCMQEAGYEYIPVGYSPTDPSDAPDAAYGTREFAEKYGYGATTRPWVTNGPDPAFTDPNLDYVDSLSPAEQDAYWTALYGELDYEGDTNGGWERGGCQSWAEHQVTSDQNAFEDERFVALQLELEEMWLAAMEDERLSQLERRWSACMADAGFPGLAGVEEAANTIYEEVNAIWERAWATLPDSPTVADYDRAERTAQQELSILTEREIEMAMADLTCRDEVRYLRTQQEISAEHQQRFYDAHRTELEAWASDYRRN
jgi:hypothetical protein